MERVILYSLAMQGTIGSAKYTACDIYQDIS